MTSKTGYLCPGVRLDTAGQIDLSAKSDTHYGKRVCIRVEEVPKQMTREELGEKLEWGWEVKYCSTGPLLVLFKYPGGINTYPETYAGGLPYRKVTHARPWSGAPWIEIVEEK